MWFTWRIMAASCSFFTVCFFKQKTAYKMRIRDWSSDVCSSDLTIVGTASDMESVTRSEVIKYSAGGFRDFTRSAASDPTMWRDVFLANKEAVLEMLQRFTEDMTALQRAIRWDDGDALFNLFSRTREIRRSIIDQGQDDARPDFGGAHD